MTKKNADEVAGEFHEHVGGLRPEEIFRHPTAKGRSKAFAFRALHQDHEDHDAAMIAQMVSKAVIRIDMGTGNMPSKGDSARRLSTTVLPDSK